MAVFVLAMMGVGVSAEPNYVDQIGQNTVAVVLNSDGSLKKEYEDFVEALNALQSGEILVSIKAVTVESTTALPAHFYLSWKSGAESLTLPANSNLSFNNDGAEIDTTADDLTQCLEPVNDEWAFTRYGDETYKVEKAVATIGDVKYPSLALALKAVKNGETIKMVDNDNIANIRIELANVQDAIILDLNGKTLTLPADIGNPTDGDSAPYGLKVLKGTLTIQDYSTEKTGKILHAAKNAKPGKKKTKITAKKNYRRTYKATTLKKKSKKFKVKAKAGSGAKMTYKVVGGKKKARKAIKVSKGGKVTVKRGTGKGYL